jgi:hypothetical protein
MFFLFAKIGLSLIFFSDGKGVENYTGEEGYQQR